MKQVIVWLVVAVVCAGALDRVLLEMESRGWVNYRKNGLNRGAALYHVYELQSIFDPGIQQVVEIQYEQREREDQAGDPPIREA